jgi:hypothetical protein
VKERKIIRIVISIILTILLAGFVNAQENSFNPLTPRYQSIILPTSGFAWIDNDLAVDSCAAPVDSLWMKQSGEEFDLYVAADGPHGSGRYWTVTVAVLKKDQTDLKNGVCVETSTIGWRTLQRFKKLPLPWVDDQNDNGWPEFIFWDSFPLNDEPTMAEFGLVGWVYELDEEGVLRLNFELTHALAAEIATAYRQPLENHIASFQQRRNEIAHMLKLFISE